MAYNAGAVTATLNLDDASFTSGIKRAGKESDKFNSKLESTAKSSEKLSDSLDDAKSSAMSFGDVMREAGKAALVTSIVQTGRSLLNTAGKFEKYNAVLTNTLGHQSLAAKSMADIEKFAASTVFSVDELTGAYVKLANRGFVPTMNEMQKLGDIAASQGKSFDQLAEAILDAQTGEMERLKEFGIRASQSGDKVTFAFKGMQQTIANTPEAIKAALVSFGELDGVAGANASMMNTWEGANSNLQDSLTSISKEIGSVLLPTFRSIVQTISGAITGIIEWKKNNEVLFNTLVKLSAIVGTIIALLIGGSSILAAMKAIAAFAPAFGAAMSSALGPVSIALAALIAGYVTLKEYQSNALKEGTSAMIENVKTINKASAAISKLNLLASEMYLESFSKERLAEYKTELEALGVSTDKLNMNTAEGWQKSRDLILSATNALKEFKKGQEATAQLKAGGGGAKPAMAAQKIEVGVELDKGSYQQAIMQSSSLFETAGATAGVLFRRNFYTETKGLTGPALEEAKKDNAKFAQVGAMIGQALTSALTSAFNSFFEMAKNKLQKSLNMMNFYSDLLIGINQNQYDAEIAMLEETENKKLEILREASAERLAIIDSEFARRKQLLDEELARQIANIDAELLRRNEYVQENADIQEQEAILTASNEDDARTMKEEAEREYQNRLNALLNESNNTRNIENQRAADAEAKLNEDKEAKKAKLDKAKEAREKLLAKTTAMLNYMGAVQGYKLNQQQGFANIMIQAAQGMMSAVTAGLMTGPAAPIVIPMLMGLVTATTAMSMAALRSAPPPLPPAELFLNKGGIVPGVGTTDTVPARLTPGEMVVDRDTTRMLRNMPSKPPVYNITINGDVDSEDRVRQLAVRISEYQGDIIHSGVY